MNLPEISIRNPVFAWMLMAALIFFGTLSFMRMGVNQMPDVDFPVVTVSMSLEGAAPEVMENEVVDVLEDAVMSLQGIRTVTSSARQGNATVSLEFEVGRNIDVALQEVQTRINQVQTRLPRDIDPPFINKVNPDDQPIMWIGLSGRDKSRRELIDFAEDQIKSQLQTISGVGDVFLGGFLDRNLRVWVNAKDLSDHEITMGDIVDTIRDQHREIPAGRIETTEKESNVRWMGEAEGVEAFGNLSVATRGGKPIYRPFPLSKVARVEDGVADIRRLARVNGEAALGLGIKKQRGANAVEVAKRVRARLTEIQTTLPKDYKLGINFDSTQFIEESISELNFTLLLSALLTSLVCWLFLGSFRSTLNVLLAIPTSILGSFLVLYFAGFTLNTFTLLGLTLAIGIVVDDAIMVLENITRHHENHKPRFQAALDGSKEISFAAIAATIAIIAIFLPVAFMTGVIGRFFFEFGVTISVAVGLSLLEALTLTPMRCSQFLEIGQNKNFILRGVDRSFLAFQHLYKSSLSTALHFKWTVTVVSVGLFVGSLFLMPYLRKEFVPAQDQSMFMVRMQAPIGSSIEFTDARFRKAESFLLSRKEVKRYFAAIGGFGGGEVDTGVLFVTMPPPHERKLSQEDFISLTRDELNKIPGMRAIVQDLSMRGFTAERGFPLEFSIRGADWKKLETSADAITAELETAGLYEDIDTDHRVGMPEVKIFPDREKASLHGVDIQAIGDTINAAIGGVRAGKYTKGGHRYDIRVRLRPEDRVSSEAIRQLYVRNNRGELIALGDVVHLEERPSVQTLQRRDRQRSVGIFANLKKGVSQAQAIDTAKKIAEKHVAPGYRVAFTGGAKTFQESFQSLFLALGLGIIVAYMVLASQFNSFLHPFTILLALPFSVTGGLLALLVTRQSLNIFSFIGLLLLMGIVKKNSILLVDFSNQARAKGLKVREALLEACPLRLRAIFMTSVATVAAAIPPALALGPGSETRIPMAIAVIGGVIVSTFLTLYVVPAVYEIVSPLERNHPKEPEEALTADPPRSIGMG